jgi:hypothetical protein
MKNAVFWDMTPCGFSKNRRSSVRSVTGATLRNIQEDGILVISNFRCKISCTDTYV